jgi:hypothetical protein
MARTVDMSPAAVARRVREVAELYEVGVRLVRAKRQGPTPRRSVPQCRSTRAQQPQL